MQPSLWYILPISQRTVFLIMQNPAILLYTADFLIGTASFTDEEVGQYARALFYQHQENGYLSDDFINRMFPTGLFPVVKSKFKQCEKGLYNERMKEEIDRRNRYSLSRSKNKRSKGKPLSNKRVTLKSYDVEKSGKFQQHMETENENKSLSLSLSLKEPSNKKIKHKYGEYKHVLLTDEEKEKLKKKFGKEGTIKKIQQMDEGIELKGYKYKSHYLAILKWAKNENITEDNERKIIYDPDGNELPVL